MKTANEATTSQNGHSKNGRPDPRSSATGLFLQPRGMKKIRCPHCAVVNLEKFVTYPHCAGCGALLTKETPPRRTWIAWRRPLGPILWATVLCCAAAGAVGAAMMLRRPAVMGQMVVYGQTLRHVTVGGTLRLSLTMDAIGGSARENSLLQTVTVRFDKDFLQNFSLVEIDPAAQSETGLGSGQYFVFEQLPREKQIDFQFKARRAGRYKLRAHIRADSQLPTDYVANVTVAPKASLSKKQL